MKINKKTIKIIEGLKDETRGYLEKMQAFGYELTKAEVVNQRRDVAFWFENEVCGFGALLLESELPRCVRDMVKNHYESFQGYSIQTSPEHDWLRLVEACKAESLS